MIYYIIGIIAYAIIGMIWLVCNLGRKHGPTYWYDYIFGPGVYLWFPFISLYRTIKKLWCRKWDS